MTTENRVRPRKLDGYLLPLTQSFFGFDDLLGRINNVLNASKENTFPPMDIYQEQDGTYVIDLAVAGFRREDISIQLNQETGLLSITGKVERDNETGSQAPQKFLHAGLARRFFQRSFTLADNVKVTGASLKDGVLTVRLNEEKKPNAEPLRISID